MKDSNEKAFNRVSQESMPRASLKEALTLAEALRDSFAAQDASPLSLAKALNRSPKSSTWRLVTGAAIAYGLTAGAYNASSISLTPLGKKVTVPLDDEERQEGLREAVRRPAVLKSFFEKYNGEKVPKDEIAKNVLNSFGVPHDRTEEAWKIVKENARFVGLIEEISGDDYIVIPIRPFYTSPPSGESTSARNAVRVSSEVEKASSGLTDIEIIQDKVILRIETKLLRNKAFRKKLDAILDSTEGLADIVQKETQKPEDTGGVVL